MQKTNPLKELVKFQKNGVAKGIYSACSANEYVIEAVLERALLEKNYALIEATANQVNQFGGYTGMKPQDFKNFVLSIAKRKDFPTDKLILGGDHLGPLTWINENSTEAMNKSIELIREYVLAGFTKIHIDTSMHLASDDKNKPLNTDIIAERGAILCREAENAYNELLEINPDSVQPVYIIGSEVPIPGGSQEKEDNVKVTKVEDFKNTIESFNRAFLKYDLKNGWENVIGVVVQPGVEFGDVNVHDYNRDAAKELTNALKNYPNIVFEGHSTDYQTADSLKKMVEDGIAILKVGPALTFALREGLFALNYIENELFKYSPEIELSNFINVLDTAMVRYPNNWRNHYHGDANNIRFSRKFSMSDRCRYYLPIPEVQEATKLMINNLMSREIPLALIDQFMPIQGKRIRCGIIKNEPEALLKDVINNYIDDYIYAVEPDRAMLYK